MSMYILMMIINWLLIALWVYAVAVKLSDVKKFRHSLTTQAFPKWMSGYLVWILPAAEITAAALLLFNQTRLWGMYFSALMMLVFTIYVGSASLLFFKHYPCPCGGLFSRMGWKRHFKINIFFTLLSFLGILLLTWGGM